VNGDACVVLPSQALPVERQVIPVFPDHRVNNQRVGEFAFLHDARRRRRAGDAFVRTVAAGALLALDHPHEVFGGFDVENFALLVADYVGLPAALAAAALLWRAGDEFLHARQMGGQFDSAGLGITALASGLACFLVGLVRFGVDLAGLHARFGLQQAQLLVGKLLTLSPILLNPHQPDHLVLEAKQLLELFVLRLQI